MSMLLFGLIGPLAIAWMALVDWSQWVNAHRIMDNPAIKAVCFVAMIAMIRSR
jgi:hypothetical protein